MPIMTMTATSRRASFRVLATLLISFCCSLWASAITVVGVLIDESTNEPIPYAAIALKQGTKVLRGSMSNELGEWEITDLTPGTYSIEATMMGYTPAIKRFNLSGKSKQANLGNILMHEDTQMLQEVEVVAQASQARFDIDKKVFSVDQSIAAAGGDATEVLQGIPSVEVDPDGEISLRNNSNVEIWINGKPSGLDEENRAQVLEQMPAENIESIEIITNPGAKYSPEGSSGIINIVLKKDRKAGVYGSVTSALSHNAHSDRVGGKVGAALNFNVKRWDGTFNATYDDNYRGDNYNSERKLNDAAGNVASVIDQNRYTRNRRQGVNISTQLNYRLADNHSLGVLASVSQRHWDYERKLRYTKTAVANDSVERSYLRYTDGVNEPRYINASLNHTWKVDSFGSTLTSSAGYSNYYAEKNYNYLQTAGGNLDQNQVSHNNNNTYEFKSDFSLRRNKRVFDAGIDFKYVDRHNLSNIENNVAGSYVTDPLLRNDYRYKEALYAAYLSYGSRIRNFSYSLGLRGEYIDIRSYTNDVANPRKGYFEPFPTVFLSYALPADNEIQLSYTRRINRPRGSNLNSYKDFSDSSNITFGNPDLDPEFVSAIELNYIKQWTQHTFSASLYYQHTSDVIQRFSFLGTDSTLYTSFLNLTKRNRMGAELVLKNSITKYLNLTSTFNLYYDRIEDCDFTLPPTMLQSATPLHSTVHLDGDEDFSWTAKMLANVMITKTFSGQLTANYNSSKIIAQGKQDGFFTLDLGLRKTFWNKRLATSFTVRDLLYTRKIVQRTHSEGFSQVSTRRPFGPRFRINLTYNFGNNKSKKKGDRRSDDDEPTVFDNVEEF